MVELIQEKKWFRD